MHYFAIYPKDEGGLCILKSKTRDGLIKRVLKLYPQATLIYGKVIQNKEKE